MDEIDCFFFQKFFPGIHITKGMPKHPQPQGKIKRDQENLNQKLQKWKRGQETAIRLLGASLPILN